MIRPPLHADPRFTLVVGICALVVAAALAAVTVFFTGHLGDATPSPTSWHTGDGDTVVITPRALRP